MFNDQQKRSQELETQQQSKENPKSQKSYRGIMSSTVQRGRTVTCLPHQIYKFSVGNGQERLPKLHKLLFLCHIFESGCSHHI